MNLTVKAVLARWNGDRHAAIEYCYTIMDAYPQLRDEYSGIVDALTGHEEKAKGQYAGA
jgi:hypothetical protein